MGEWSTWCHVSNYDLWYMHSFLASLRNWLGQIRVPRVTHWLGHKSWWLGSLWDPFGAKIIKGANPLVALLMRHLPSTGTTRDKSLALALMVRDVFRVGVWVLAFKKKNKGRAFPLRGRWFWTHCPRCLRAWALGLGGLGSRLTSFACFFFV